MLVVGFKLVAGAVRQYIFDSNAAKPANIYVCVGYH